MGKVEEFDSVPGRRSPRLRERQWLAKQALGEVPGRARQRLVRPQEPMSFSHCVQLEDDFTNRGLTNRLGLTEAVCDVLQLDPDRLADLPDVSKVLDRYDTS